MYLPTNISFNPMHEFITEIGKSVHNWVSIVNNLNIFKILVTSDFSPSTAKDYSAWVRGSLGLPSLYFGPVSIGKAPFQEAKKTHQFPRLLPQLLV